MAITQRDKAKFFTSQQTGVGTRVNGSGAGTLGSDTNGVAIYTGEATYGSIITALMFSTDDTTAGNAYVYILNGATVRPLGIVNIAIQSGDLGTVANTNALLGSGVTLLGLPFDALGKAFIHLAPGEVLKFSMKAAPTAGKTFYGTALALDGTV